jgi:hypothetical protein
MKLGPVAARQLDGLPLHSQRLHGHTESEHTGLLLALEKTK